jgi:hypothetical protein
MRPPEQFICVPFRLVRAPITSPSRVTSVVVVPAGHRVVGLGGVAEGRHRVVDLVVANEEDVAPRAPERGHAVVAPGQHGAFVEQHGLLGVVERAVLESLGQPQSHLSVPQVGNGTKRGVGRRSDGSGHEPGEGAGQGSAPGHRRARQGRASIDSCHADPLVWRVPLRDGGTSAVFRRRL